MHLIRKTILSATLTIFATVPFSTSGQSQLAHNNIAEHIEISFAALQNSEHPIEIAYPGKTWALTIKSRGFEIKQKQTKPDGDGVMIAATNEENGLIMTVYLEKAAGKGGSKECRDYYWGKAKNSPLPKTDIKMSELNEMALVEYIMPSFQGRTLNQKNVNAYLAKDGVWIDIHISKVLFKPEEWSLFREVLDSVSFKEGSTPNTSTPNSLELFAYGSQFYLARDYKNAIKWYQKALDLEKTKPSMEKKLWYVLVDNLGMAYGISGDLANAKTTFEYGISQDPSYPLFHYNLACTYGEMGDLDKAMTSLRKAFENKQRMLAGEHIPNPRTDSSFRKFLKNENFSKLLEELGQ